MAKPKDGQKRQRLRRDDPVRNSPRRSGIYHIERNIPGREDSHLADRPKGPVSDTIQRVIAGMVRLSSDTIEDQIRAGQVAAERLRTGPANPQRSETDVNLLVETLGASIRDVGTAWVDVLSIILRSAGARTSAPERPGAPPEGGALHPAMDTVTRTDTSADITTTSSVTPADPHRPSLPALIVVKDVRVKNVALDLRPRSPSFVPVVRPLMAADPKLVLSSVRFELSADQAQLILNVDLSADQPPGIYTGVIVDSTTNEPGGTLSVTVGS
jgi:hypothetical protein